MLQFPPTISPPVPKRPPTIPTTPMSSPSPPAFPPSMNPGLVLKTHPHRPPPRPQMATQHLHLPLLLPRLDTLAMRSMHQRLPVRQRHMVRRPKLLPRWPGALRLRQRRRRLGMQRKIMMHLGMRIARVLSEGALKRSHQMVAVSWQWRKNQIGHFVRLSCFGWRRWRWRWRSTGLEGVQLPIASADSCSSRLMPHCWLSTVKFGGLELNRLGIEWSRASMDSALELQTSCNSNLNDLSLRSPDLSHFKR